MIKYPDLEIRNEDQLVAEAVARTSGALTTALVEAQIRERQEILKLIAAGLPPNHLSRHARIAAISFSCDETMLSPSFFRSSLEPFAGISFAMSTAP